MKCNFLIERERERESESMTTLRPGHKIRNPKSEPNSNQKPRPVIQSEM